MTRTELREFIIAELKRGRPDISKPEGIADFILGQPFMRSKEAVEGFLKGYLADKERGVGSEG